MNFRTCAQRRKELEPPHEMENSMQTTNEVRKALEVVFKANADFYGTRGLGPRAFRMSKISTGSAGKTRPLTGCSSTAFIPRPASFTVSMTCYVGDSDRGLQRMFSDPIAEGAMDLWVLPHPEVRRATRVRASTAFIADAVLADRNLFEGRRPQLPRSETAIS